MEEVHTFFSSMLLLFQSITNAYERKLITAIEYHHQRAAACSDSSPSLLLIVSIYINIYLKCSSVLFVCFVTMLFCLY